MQFDYEIPVDEYVSAQMLYRRLAGGRGRFQRPVGWMVVGALFILVAAIDENHGLAPALLAVIGGWWIYAGIGNLFPAGHFRRAYPKSGVMGKKYHADISEEGFEVSSELRTWRVRWAGVSQKGEDEQFFVLFSAGTLFIFGKRYLTDEQQQELRKLANLTFR